MSGSSKDYVRNGPSNPMASYDVTSGDDSIQKNTPNKSSVKKKDFKAMSQRYPSTESSDYADGKKFKEKKKKVPLNVEDIGSTASSSPKFSKNPKKFNREMSLESAEYSSKVNSSDNMRKPLNRRASVPNDSSVKKSFYNTPVNNSPKPYKSIAKSPKSDSKYRAKTPDSKGASGYTPSRKGNPAKRGINFEPYIPLFQVQQGLKRGEFIEGALRINPRNYEDAYVSAPDGKMDIYIGGMQNRNRALNGDIVVVQVNPKQEWKVLCDAIKDYQEKNGKFFADTICEPISPAGPCKVHTPDPFVRPRPFSSSSWDATRGQRSPDTLEILGIDKIAQQFGGISIKSNPKPKIKRKSKSSKQSESVSQKSSSASYSQESSEDCLDKLSPEQSTGKGFKDGTHLDMIESESFSSGAFAKENVNRVPFKNMHCEPTYPPCDMTDIGEFHAEIEDCKNNKWLGNENSVNIVISPDELLQIDGNSILDDSSFLQEEFFGDNSSDIEGIVVPPGDLSGDDYTDSATADSESDHMEKAMEDSAFLACNQDAQNNNVDFFPQNIDNLINIPSYNPEMIIPTDNSTTGNSAGLTANLDAQCKMQFNRSVPSVISFDTNSEVVTSTLAEVSPESHFDSIQQNVVLQRVTGDSVSSESIENKNQLNQNGSTKKPRHRKRKKKSNSDKNMLVNEKIEEIVKTFNDIHNLTVDQVMEHPEWTRFVQKTGKVVHILERKHSCLTAGHLKLLPDRNVKWALFSPKDSRVPRILIPMSDCPQNFYHRSQDYSNVLFLAEILEWKDNSTYASGRLIKELGNTGDIEVETEGILIENGVDFQDFDEDVLACLPQEEEWSVPVRELQRRRDFRNDCVFTIDPSTARDMDDAVSCVLLKNGNYEVGVHIADVTYFVQEGTQLDSVACERSTSVYLVQKVVPMLPRKLCDELCSLTPGTDRLTFSVIWEMSPQGEIFNQWIGRSIINSCIKLSYEHAQDMIDNPTRVWNDCEHPKLYGNFTINEVSKTVNELHSLAVTLREKRFMDGALHLDQVKLQFTLNPESNLPSGFNVYVQRESNKLIEEFMLLANMTVATKIYDTFPSLALLRRHPPPEYKPMQDIITTCETMGVVLDATTSGSLQTSIARYKSDDFMSTAMVQVLMNLCSKPMNCALYFCTGALDDVRLYRHYALNVPLYTHFTSPIRRYPDIIVHRLLGAALNCNPVPCMSVVDMQKCATHANDKKYNAKRVSELSLELFLAAFIRSLGSVRAKGMVVNVMDHSFDCLVLDMGIIKRVYCDKLPLINKEYKRLKGLSLINLFWKDECEKKGIKQAIVMFSLVDVILVVEDESLQIKVVLTKPEKK